MNQQQQFAIEHRRNPLILPEIRNLVGRFLENNDILSLICVSQAFYFDFIHFLWSNIVFNSHLQRKLSRKAFQEHGHSIRELTLLEYNTVLKCWKDAQCTNLKSLEILPVKTSRRIEESHDFIPDIIEESDSEALLESTSKAIQENTALEEGKQHHPLEKRVFRLIDLIQQQNNLSVLKLTWSSTFLGEFSRRFYGLPNQLVELHLLKWTVSLDDLNMLVENSPCLLEFFARGLIVEPSSSEASAPSMTTSDETLNPSETSDEAPIGSEQQQQHDQESHPVLNFGHIRHLRLCPIIIRISPITIDCPAAKSIEFSEYRGRSATLQDKVFRRGHIWNCPRLEKFLYTGQTDGMNYGNEYSRRGPLATILDTSLTSNSTSNLARVSAQDYSCIGKSTDNQFLQQRQTLRRIALTCCSELGRNGSGLWQLVQSSHGASLETIDLSYSTGLSSLDIYSILTSCERLRRFQGSEDYLEGRDVLSSTLGPWKCTGLERLQIRFRLTPHIRNAQATDIRSRYIRRCPPPSSLTESQKNQVDAMYNQLSALRHLKVLDLSGFGSIDDCTRGIPLTLKRGLGKLAELSEMEIVHVTEWITEMREGEGEWIARHWPKLKTIYALRNNNNDGEWKRFYGCLGKAQKKSFDDM
ncbi:hypothetical protein BGZ46_008377 [Entomortierella lignicola]|nr:hypothetical protein BGZ46_008377 [Entomortierella lignicola]